MKSRPMIGVADIEAICPACGKRRVGSDTALGITAGDRPVFPASLRNLGHGAFASTVPPFRLHPPPPLPAQAETSAARSAKSAAEISSFDRIECAPGDEVDAPVLI